MTALNQCSDPDRLGARIDRSVLVIVGALVLHSLDPRPTGPGVTRGEPHPAGGVHLGGNGRSHGDFIVVKAKLEQAVAAPTPDRAIALDAAAMPTPRAACEGEQRPAFIERLTRLRAPRRTAIGEGSHLDPSQWVTG